MSSWDTTVREHLPSPAGRTTPAATLPWDQQWFERHVHPQRLGGALRVGGRARRILRHGHVYPIWRDEQLGSSLYLALLRWFERQLQPQRLRGALRILPRIGRKLRHGTFTQSGGTNNVGSSGSLYLGTTVIRAARTPSAAWGCFPYPARSTSAAPARRVQSNRWIERRRLPQHRQFGQLPARRRHAPNQRRRPCQSGSLQPNGRYGLAVGRRQCDHRTSRRLSLVNTGSMTLSIGPNSLLLVPAGFNPVAAFRPLQRMRGCCTTSGSPLTIFPGQGFSGIGSLADHVYCQGAISAASGGEINLTAASVSGARSVNLGSNGSFTVNDTLSGMSRVALWRLRLHRLFRRGHVYAVRRSEQRQQLHLCRLQYRSARARTTNPAGRTTSAVPVTLPCYSVGSSGNYILSGSGILFSEDEFVGILGPAARLPSPAGRANSRRWQLYLGDGSVFSGSNNLSGSGLLTGYDEWLGYSGCGLIYRNLAG